ncbi:MAG: amino acid permease, partial [Bacteroidota bacterium]
MAKEKKSKISLQTAMAIVIANMIGTGVFTSLGFQIGGGIDSVFVLLMLWIVGGIIALCGALSYGELAALMPRSGGEYHYLSEIYHPALGFMSGWTSMTVGFAAPVAAAAVALGTYTNSVFPNINPTFLAVVVVLMLTFIHAYDLKAGSIFQNISTNVKLGLVIFFVLSG